MDLYIVLFQIFNQYTLAEIEISKNNIRGLLKKVMDQKLVKYLPYIENFYKNLIFKIIDQGYISKELYKDKEKLNDYICNYLIYLTLHGSYKKEQIYDFIEKYDQSVIDESAKILYSLKKNESIKSGFSF